MNSLYQTYSPFVPFVDLDALNRDICAIPSRNRKCRELAVRVDAIRSKIRDAYVEASRKYIEGSSPSYFMPVKEIDTENRFLTVTLDEFAPMIPLLRAKAEIEGTVYEMTFRESSYTRDVTGMKMSCTAFERDLGQVLSDYAELTSKSVSIRNQCIEVPIFEGDLSGEEAMAVKEIVSRHFADAERRIDEWLGDLGEYADPFSLFGAMI